VLLESLEDTHRISRRGGDLPPHDPGRQTSSNDTVPVPLSPVWRGGRRARSGAGEPHRARQRPHPIFGRGRYRYELM